MESNCEYHFTDDVSQRIPEQRLCAAILARAISDYISPLGQTAANDQTSAKEWIADDGDHVSSFRWACQASLGHEGDGEALAEKIRARLGIEVDEGSGDDDIEVIPAWPKFQRQPIIPGTVYDYFTVVAELKAQKGEKSGRMVDCECKCGERMLIPWQDLRTGKKRSCGCKPKTRSSPGILELRRALAAGEKVSAQEFVR